MGASASSMPRRIVRSIQYAPQPSFQPQLGSEEMFSHSWTTLNPEHIREAVSGTEGCLSQPEEEDSDATFAENFQDQGRVEAPIGRAPSGRPECTTPDAEAGEGVSAVVEGWPSPKTKLQQSHTKRRRVPGLASISERMMELSSSLSDRTLEHSSRPLEREMEVRHHERVEDAVIAEKLDLKERQDRTMVQKVLRQNTEVVKSACGAFNELVAIQRAHAKGHAGADSTLDEGDARATVSRCRCGSNHEAGARRALPSRPHPIPQSASTSHGRNKRVRLKKKIFSPRKASNLKNWV